MFGPSFGGSPGSPPTTLLFQGQPPLNLHYRPLQQSDYDALKAIHRDLFPIDYEEVFFRKAIGGEDRVFSWAALHNEYGRDHLVGFVTARLVYLYECDPMDRQVMGLTSKCLDGEGAVYVLTLGVVSSCRQCGIARSLLGLVQQHAARVRCRAIFLHVISYNDAAMRLYGGSGYQAMARLPNFYHLITGRQPNPEQSWYDAFLYALFIPHSGPEPSAAMQWAGGMLGAAVAPLRSVLGTFNGCIPSWFCRQTYSTFLPFAAGGGAAAVAASQRSASKGSLADTATSAWQQQQQHAPPWQALALPPSSQSQAQSQQPLPVSNPAGVVCAGVTAEHFLRRGGSQHQPQHHPHPQPHPQQQPYAHPPSCNGGQRHPKDLGASSQVTVAGGGSGAGPGPHSQQQQQQPYNKGSMSYGLDSVGGGGGGGGGGGSSAASSGSVSGEAAHPQLGTAPPTLQPLSRQPHPQPLLRPPSPPIPPNLAPSMTSLQQRHPHHGGSSGASTPSHAGGGGPNGHHRSHHGQHHHQHQHHQHYHQQQGSTHGGQYGVGGGSGGPGAHGRNGEHSRGGIHRGSPQGMAGGGLYPAGNPSQWQQQPQQSGGSVLAMLFRPPTAQQHPHSR